MSTIDKVKNVLHPNKDHSTASTTSTGSTLNSGTTGGYSGANTGTGSTLNSGTTGGYSGANTGTGSTLNSGTTGGYSGANRGVTGTSGNAATAPHSSKIASILDPRIESNGNRNTGGVTGVGATGTTGNYSGAGTGLNNTTTSTNAGPHSSNIANKLDPRFDSDRGGSRNLGAANGTSSTGAYSGTQTGNHIGHTGDRGGISNSTNAGPHDSNLGNELDPRVESDLSGRGNRHGATNGGIMGASGSHATPGSGTTQNTAGPHNSDLANKLDPRVDSDLSGGRTIGGNLTNA